MTEQVTVPLESLNSASISERPLGRREADAQAAPDVVGIDKAAWPTANLVGLAVALLLALAAACAALLVGRWESTEEARQAEQQLVDSTRREATAIGERIEERLRLLSLIAIHPDWQSRTVDTDQREALVELVHRLWPQSSRLTLLDDGGVEITSAGGRPRGEPATNSAWLDQALRGPSIIDEAQPLLAVAPVKRASGQTVGVLTAEMDCASLFTRTPTTLQTSTWALVNRQGRVLCRQGSAEIGDVNALPKQGVLWISKPDAWLVAVQVLQPTPSAGTRGWRLVQAQTAQAATPRATGRWKRGLAAGGLVALLALPMAWLFADRLSQPLRALALKLNRARERAEYDASEIPIRGTREARAVGQAARAMLDQINEQQASLLDSATGYRELFELHPLPMWVIDKASLRFLEVNYAALRMYGWRRDEFLAMTLRDVYPTLAQDTLGPALTDICDQEHHAAVWQHSLRSGEIIDVEMVSRQLRWFGSAALIAAMSDMTPRRRASIELQRQRRDLSALARQLMTAEESERRQLAQALHDRITPALFGVKLNLEVLRTRTDGLASPEDLRAEVHRVAAPLVKALDGTIADTRNLMSDLRPPLLVERGLAAALEHEVQRQSRLPVELSFLHRGAKNATSRDLALEYATFMIAQAALNNAMQHASARNVTVDLDESKGQLRLSVRDDGVGFDSAAAPPAGHLGLLGMQERAQWIGATLTVDSAPGMGTTVQVLWADTARTPTPV